MGHDFTIQDIRCLHNAIDLQLKERPMSEINALKRRELLNKLQAWIDSMIIEQALLVGAERNE